MKWKMIKVGIFFSAVVLASALAAFSQTPAETPSPELIAKGRDLFNKKEGLAVKFACILCHKKDKAVKKSEIEKAGDKLPAVINKYITTKAKGKALAPDCPEMQALIAYITYEHAK